MLPLYWDNLNFRTPSSRKHSLITSGLSEKLLLEPFHTFICSMFLACFSALPNDFRSPKTVPKKLRQRLAHNKCSINVSGTNEWKEERNSTLRSECHTTHLSFPGLTCRISLLFAVSPAPTPHSHEKLFFSPRDNLKL